MDTHFAGKIAWCRSYSKPVKLEPALIHTILYCRSVRNSWADSTEQSARLSGNILPRWLFYFANSSTHGYIQIHISSSKIHRQLKHRSSCEIQLSKINYNSFLQTDKSIVQSGHLLAILFKEIL